MCYQCIYYITSGAHADAVHMRRTDGGGGAAYPVLGSDASALGARVVADGRVAAIVL